MSRFSKDKSPKIVEPWSQRAYIFALNPNLEQKRIFSSWCGATKQMYNDLLYVYEVDYEQRLNEACQIFSQENGLSLEEVLILYKDLEKRKELKKSGFKLPKSNIKGYKVLSELEKAGRFYYSEPPAQTKTAVSIAVEDAWKKYFTQPNSGRPKRKNHYNRLACRFQFQDSKSLGVNYIRIPKIGTVRCFENPLERVLGKIQYFTIYKDVDRWFISISVSDATQPKQIPKIKKSVGIDLNTGKKALAKSDGDIIPLPSEVSKLEKRIKREQRKVSRRKFIKDENGRKRISKNRAKAQLKLSKLQRKLRWFRKDWQDKNTYKIATTYEQIAIENVRWSNLTKSTKGTIEEPGKNVAQKSGLNRSILRVGLYEIRRQLEYKSLWYGAKLEIVDPKNTTQACSNCGHIKLGEEKISLKIRTYHCDKCGLELDRDINSAKNVEKRAFESV